MGDGGVRVCSFRCIGLRHSGEGDLGFGGILFGFDSDGVLELENGDFN